MKIIITEKDWELIVSVLGDEASAEENEEFQQWLATSPDHEEYFQELKKDWSQFGSLISYKKYNPKSAWQKLEEKAKDELKELNSKSLVLNLSKFSELIKIAASFIIAFGLSWLVWQSLPKNKAISEQSVFQVDVPKGEKTQFLLADGTKVWINSDSKLTYSSNFGRKERRVQLTGEAFFDVTKNKSKPFIVETPEFNVKVTGTSFNLNTYQEDEVNSLTLHTGEVFITKLGEKFKVSPGEKYSLNLKTQKSIITKTELKESSLWKEGYVVIDDMNLEEISKILERKFNVQVNITNDNYKKIRFTGTFKPYETLDEVLGLISSASPVKFKHQLNKEKNVVSIE